LDKDTPLSRTVKRVFFTAQSSTDCISNMYGFDFRQAQRTASDPTLAFLGQKAARSVNPPWRNNVKLKLIAKAGSTRMVVSRPRPSRAIFREGRFWRKAEP
jgi:hypothetical protein